MTIVERLTVTGEARRSAGGQPEGRGWRVAENVLWHMARNGPLSLTELQDRRGRFHTGLRLGDLHSLLYPTSEDLVRFLVLLGLESGIEIESCKELRPDCLGRAEGGRVEVHYRKRPAGGHQWRSQWFRDTGMFSPGRLIRSVVRLTGRARAQCGSDRLWLAVWNHSIGPPGLAAGSGLFTAFVTRHRLPGDDGAPLALQPCRLRKTHKAGRYLITQGQLHDFAGGSHSRVVAGDHYGAVEALRPVHEAAVERALHDAVAPARACTVLTAEQEQGLAADPTTGGELLGVAPAEVKAFLAGQRDVWLSSCGNFFDSPFGRPGSACPTPFWACLACTNAVITTRKLPALLSFLAHMVEARATMSAPQWAVTYGEANRLLTGEVLPRFAPAVVAAARAAADAEPDSVYLPPQLRAGRP